jgi:hypothetical protein
MVHGDDHCYVGPPTYFRSEGLKAVFGTRPRRVPSARFDRCGQVEGSASRGSASLRQKRAAMRDIVASDNSDFFPQRRLQKPPAFGQLVERGTQLLHLLGGETSCRSAR